MAESAADPEVKRLGLFHQLIRFGLIGGVCAVIDYGSYMLLLGVGWPNWLARSLAFVLGTSCSYIANRRLTFYGARTGNTKAKAGAFAVVYLATFLVNIGVNQLLFVTLPDFAVAYGAQLRWSICWVVGQGLGTGLNFVLLKWAVFRE
ncbi:GtrA family protein [Haloactinomyces albus]|uniref:Flippase GtrA n=1 Tax=Haloactinomyces albus TaxID=1352928 RepID=A0AAE3ZBF8_9ACTN|nr:GtrA family protein [Haloactinomyces albus]MDR7301848.1 putative flippase GtrA [Haloactinomyces albus]